MKDTSIGCSSQDMPGRSREGHEGWSGKMRRVLFCLLFLLVIQLCIQPMSGGLLASNPSLAEVLTENGIDLSNIDTPNMGKDITSYQVLNDPNVFCIAYYLDNGSGRMRGKLYIHLLKKDQSKWTHGTLDFETLPGRYSQRSSITRIQYSRDHIYLHAHWNPSAGATLALSNELEFQYGLYGWILAGFEDETVVYQKNQVHFAPTHYAEIYIYDPRTERDRKIYPMKPDKGIRLEHIKKVKAAYDERGEDWFRIHNHHMNPELFNNYLRDEVVVNDSTDSLAFVVVYKNEDHWSYEDILRRYNFRKLRGSFNASGIPATLPDSVFSYLYTDLEQIRRLCRPDDVLKLFEGDRELHKMLQDALKTEKQEGESCRQYFLSLDANWGNPDIWKRLWEIILWTPPGPELTEVVYIYRNVKDSERITYRELLLDDLKKRYTDVPTSGYLEPERLKEIFGI